MWPNPQFSADLVTFTEEILNGKLHFFVQCHWRSLAPWLGEIHSGEDFSEDLSWVWVSFQVENCTLPKEYSKPFIATVEINSQILIHVLQLISSMMGYFRETFEIMFFTAL